VYLSRASFRMPRSHGFYRFFAWESLLTLLLLNARRWFDEPFSPRQIVSWLLLLISLFLVVQGARMLRRLGRPDDRRNETPMIGIEKTTALVTQGIYRHIRHPLYSSLFFLGWGIFFKFPSWPGALFALAASMFLVRTARVEEGENIRYFGEVYQDYMKKTTMFVPFVL